MSVNHFLILVSCKYGITAKMANWLIDGYCLQLSFLFLKNSLSFFNASFRTVSLKGSNRRSS